EGEDESGGNHDEGDGKRGPDAVPERIGQRGRGEIGEEIVQRDEFAALALDALREDGEQRPGEEGDERGGNGGQQQVRDALRPVNALPDRCRLAEDRRHGQSMYVTLRTPACARPGCAAASGCR